MYKSVDDIFKRDIPKLEEIKIGIEGIIRDLDKEYHIISKNQSKTESKFNIHGYIENEVAEEFRKIIQKRFSPIKAELRDLWLRFIIEKEEALKLYVNFLADNFMVNPRGNFYQTDNYLEVQGICTKKYDEKQNKIKSKYKGKPKKEDLRVGKRTELTTGYIDYNRMVELLRDDKFIRSHLPVCEDRKCPGNLIKGKKAKGRHPLDVIATINHLIVRGKYNRYDLVQDRGEIGNKVSCISSRLKSGGRFMLKFVEYVLGERKYITDIAASRLITPDKRLVIVRDKKIKFKFYKLSAPFEYYSKEMKQYRTLIETQIMNVENFHRMENSQIFHHKRYEEIKNRERTENWTVLHRELYTFFNDVFYKEGMYQQVSKDLLAK